MPAAHISFLHLGTDELFTFGNSGCLPRRSADFAAAGACISDQLFTFRIEGACNYIRYQSYSKSESVTKSKGIF